jgi:tRNA-dihydrouridine synthase
MSDNAADLRQRLENSLFLSSMMGVTDGAWCAQASQGCAMVQLGAYLAEPTATNKEIGRDARSFLPADDQACADFLTEACRQATARSDVVVCMNLATPKLEWGLDAAERFWQAGGHLIELNVHGGYKRYLDQGKLRAMVEPANQKELFEWVQAFNALEIPLIVKFHGQSDQGHLLPVLDEMARLAPFGVHVNVRHEASQGPDVDLVGLIKERYPGFLLVSGYVRSATDIQALFDAGAHMVGFAAPVIKDAAYIHKLAQALGTRQM